MLDYYAVVNDLTEQINAYTLRTKNSGVDSGFYQECADRLQGALDEITAKGIDNATQQDLIVGWQAMRDCKQKRAMKACMENGGYILAGMYLLGFITANIYYKLKKK